MVLGHLPLLTKGGVALMLGGKDIIPFLSEDVPGRAMLLVQLCSAFFQLFIYCYKKIKFRKLVSYTYQLQQTIFESSLNLYGLNIIILSKLCKYFKKFSSFYNRLLPWCYHRNSSQIFHCSKYHMERRR